MTARRARLVAAVLALLTLAGAGGATAASPPGRGWATLYLRAEGCGEEAGENRLEPRKGKDTRTGCGTLGGNLVDEIAYQALSATMFEPGIGQEFVTGDAGGVGFRLRRGTITGQIAARSPLPAGGGAGTFHVDIVLNARAATGRYLAFARTSGSVALSPGQTIARVPFAIPVGRNDGQVLTEVRLGIYRRGVGVGMDADQLDGESWISFPRS